MTFRQISNPMRKLITNVEKRWRGDRFSIIISESVVLEEETHWGYKRPMYGRLLNLRTGLHDDLTRSRIEGTIQRGMSLLHFSRDPNYDRMADLVFYVPPNLGVDETIEGELSVARDAFLSGDEMNGYLLSRAALPAGWALFRELCRREIKSINDATKNS